MRFQAAFGRGTRGQRVPTLLCQRCFTRNVETVAVELYCRQYVGTDASNAGCVGWALVAHAVVLRDGCMPARFQAAFGCGTRGQRVPTLPCQRCFTRNVETVAVELHCRRHAGMDARNADCVGWHLLPTRLFCGADVCLRGFRLPLGVGRVGSECPPYFANGILQGFQAACASICRAACAPQ